MPHDDLPSDYATRPRVAPRPFPKGEVAKGVFRTPEAIREGIDQRRRKRPITVTVTGERGSGKTTLIAVVAQALENSGHKVTKGPFVPNATSAVMDLREQFDVTFVEQYDADSTFIAENAKLRATVEDLRGSTAGLSNENARMRDENRRMTYEDEKLRAENLRMAHVDEKLRAEIALLKQALSEAMSVMPIAQSKVREQVDMAFEEVRQAAYLEMERNRLRTRAEDLKAEARKLSNEGDARMQKARERMLFALSGGPVESVVMDDEVEEFERPRTLYEQAQDVYAGTREASATERLLQANSELMAEDFAAEGC